MALAAHALVLAALLQAPAAPPAAPFVENLGQWDARALFAWRSGGAAAFVARDRIALQVDPGRFPAATSALHLVFDGGSAAGAVGADAVAGLHHFLRGRDPAAWRTGARGFAAVVLDEVWPGIDVRLAARDGSVEYDFVLAPGAEPSAVVLRCEGADSLAIEADGSLALTCAAGTIRIAPPRAFVADAAGARREVRCEHRLLDPTRVGYDVAAPGTEERLVIDPSVVFATHLGGSSLDTVHAVRVDSGGRVYAAGQTWSPDYPVHAGLQPAQPGVSDGFVTVLAPDGATAVFSTWFGGTDFDAIRDLELRPAAAGVEVAVAGQTASPDLPTTTGAFDPTLGGALDAFVSVLAADGAALVFSTYLGGAADEEWLSPFFEAPDSSPSTALGGDGRLWVAGQTRSADFPVTPGAIDAVLDHGGAATADAFVAAFAPSGALVYATYLGGGAHDSATDVGIAADGTVLVVGATSSDDFPTTPGALASQPSGLLSAYGSRLDPALSSLTASTYLLPGATLSMLSAVGATADGDVLVAGSFHFGAIGFETFGTATLLRLDPLLGEVRLQQAFGKGALADVALDASGRVFVAANLLTFQNQSYKQASRLDAEGDPVVSILDTASGGAAYSLGVGPNGRAALAGHRGGAATAGVFDSSTDGIDGFVLVADLECAGSYLAQGAGCGAGAIPAPRLEGNGCPQSGWPMQLELSVAAGSQALFFVGAGAGTLPLPGGCALGGAPLLPAVAVVPVATTGKAVLSFTTPALAAAASAHVQAIVPLPGGGFAVSNGLRVNAAP